jgi:hypothetical protein
LGRWPMSHSGHKCPKTPRQVVSVESAPADGQDRAINGRATHQTFGTAEAKTCRPSQWQSPASVRGVSRDPPGARGDKIMRVRTRTSLADEVIE